MEILDKYFTLQKEIYEYFGYEEEWKVFPVDDCREEFWRMEDGNNIRFCESENAIEAKKILDDEENGNYCEEEIFTYCHLDKHIFIGKDFTMCLVNTHVDGNIFLRIFSNDREVN